MKFALRMLMCLLVSPTTGLGIQHSTDWITYNSKEGRYTVQLPSEPTVGSQESATADGVKFTQYKAVVASDAGIFMIGYFDYPTDTIFTMNNARDGMVTAVNGTLVSERPVTLGKYNGREIRISAKDETGDYVDLARIYDVERRVYILQLLFRDRRDSPIDAIANRYFGSFQVSDTADVRH